MMDKRIYLPGEYEGGINCLPLTRFGHEKTAEDKSQKLDQKVVDLVKSIKPDPDKHIYVLLTAMGAGDSWGSNSNADFFRESQLNPGPEIIRFGHKTFLNAGVFAHHKNKDMGKSFGKVLLSIFNPKMKRVELIERVDRDKAKQFGTSDIYDRLNDGEHLDVSMGCRVKFDICMICGNKAPTRLQYCKEMLERPGSILSDGRRVCVDNPEPVFFDISFVTVGAAKNAKVMEKLAEKDGRVCLGNICSVEKTASVVSDAEIGAKHKGPAETYQDQIINDVLRDYLIQKKIENKLHDEITLESLRAGMRRAPAYDGEKMDRWTELERIEPRVKVAIKKITFAGIDINIEVKKGGVRKGKTWKTVMKCDYGYIPKTDGEDGEPVDVYINDSNNDSNRVFIIRQIKADKSYDEDKVMLGFNNRDEAKEMYLDHIPSKFFGSMMELSVDDFKKKYLKLHEKIASAKDCNCGCEDNCVTSNPDSVIDELLNRAKSAAQSKKSEIIKKLPAIASSITSTDLKGKLSVAKKY